MTAFADNIDSDGSRRPLTGDYPFRTKRTITFAGATDDAWGNDGGALDGAAIFTVTGAVLVKVLGVCTTNLAGSGTHAVGFAGQTTIFLPTEAALDINAGDFVINNATVAAYFITGEQAAAADNLPEYALNGQDIILTVAGGANIESGVIDYYCFWKPISDDGQVTATTT
ncbi:MAG TPA: hypothetical protein VJ327_00205 [Patescibacteria group bacterium]|nr:hypothetical protein [Patescibacteria group bacterium]